MDEVVTVWLARARAGDAAALGQAYAGMYADLKRAAHAQLRRGGGEFNTTALVNETYLKLSADRNFRPEDRRQLLLLSARAMRQVLVDHVREQNALKRGGGQAPLTLITGLAQAQDARAGMDVLELNQLLDLLMAVDERAAQGVELRFFGGYTETEIADLQGVAVRTVKRDWRKANAFLLTELQR